MKELTGKTHNLHPVLLARLRQLRQEADVSVYSGWRSSTSQQKLYEDYVSGRGNPANKPGTSNHEAVPYGSPMALAADLDGDLDAAHAAAPRYGLWFPIPKEPWHVQPVEVRDSYFTGVPELEGDDDMAIDAARLFEVPDQINHKLDVIIGEAGGMRDQLRDHDGVKAKA